MVTESEPSTGKARTDYKTTLRHILFGSDEKSVCSSSSSKHAHSQERDDNDGSGHRESADRGTDTYVGTTQEALDRNVLRLAPENKPWFLPERLINQLSGETTEQH